MLISEKKIENDRTLEHTLHCYSLVYYLYNKTPNKFQKISFCAKIEHL